MHSRADQPTSAGRAELPTHLLRATTPHSSVREGFGSRNASRGATSPTFRVRTTPPELASRSQPWPSREQAPRRVIDHGKANASQSCRLPHSCQPTQPSISFGGSGLSSCSPSLIPFLNSVIDLPTERIAGGRAIGRRVRSALTCVRRSSSPRRSWHRSSPLPARPRRGRTRRTRGLRAAPRQARPDRRRSIRRRPRLSRRRTRLRLGCRHHRPQPARSSINRGRP